MAANGSSGYLINVPDDQGFDIAAGKMDSDVLGFFRGAMQQVANAPRGGAASLMHEGQEFLDALGQARDALNVFMSATAEGLDGYKGVIQRIGAEHRGMVAMTTANLARLVREYDGPVAINPVLTHPQPGGAL
jgi:hypothetical protein